MLQHHFIGVMTVSPTAGSDRVKLKQNKNNVKQKQRQNRENKGKISGEETVSIVLKLSVNERLPVLNF